MARSLLAGVLRISAAIRTAAAVTNPLSQAAPKLIYAAVSDAINVVQLAAGTCSGIPKRVPDLDVYHRLAVDDRAELLQDTTDLASAKTSVSTYLGRLWKNYSLTVVMGSYLGDVITPAGWLEWDGDFALQTLYYGEASTADRVKWPSYRVINSSEETNQLTAYSFIQANEWVSSTAVPYQGCLH